MRMREEVTNNQKNTYMRVHTFRPYMHAHIHTYIHTYIHICMYKYIRSLIKQISKKTQCSASYLKYSIHPPNERYVWHYGDPRAPVLLNKTQQPELITKAKMRKEEEEKRGVKRKKKRRKEE